MRTKHIVVVDDVEELLSSLERRLQSVYGSDYQVYGFTNAKDALKHIDREIDANGNTLALVASDEKMSGMQGHELLEAVGKTHSNTRRILYSGYTDYNALRKALNHGVDEFVQKANPNESSEGLYAVIDAQLQEFEREPKIELDSGDIIIRLADTQYERQGLFACRYRNYLRAQYLTQGDLTPEQKQKEQEWDEYDNIPDTRYVVVKMNGKVIGGARIVDGTLPMETGTITKTGEGFSLAHYRDQGIHVREISRLVVDREHRTRFATVLTGIFRMIAHLTRDHDYMWCTSREKQIPLYQAIGFELIYDDQDQPITIEYRLRGAWYPMIRSWTKIVEEPRKIQGFAPDFHAQAIKQIERVDPKEWAEFSKRFNDLANRTNYYTAFFVPDEK
jgi:FixJ family two-component response regulator/predicted GNAT family N-acyltransferase